MNPQLLEGIYFDAAEVQDAFDFVGSLTLTKATRSEEPESFRLLRFGRRFIGNLLGWKRADGRRLYRKAYWSMARKNAKTQSIAALALILLVLGEEAEPEIYAAATAVDQASKLFEAAASMVYAHEELRDELVVTDYKKLIYNPRTGGKFQALTADGKSKHGSNPSAVLLDEFHAWGAAQEELYAALTTGSGARKQPLEVIITTAGVDEHSLCGRAYEYATRVLTGLTQDPAYYAQIHEVPKDADWTDKSLWHLANPSLGAIVQMEYLEEEFQRALAMPSLQTDFRRLYLNQWVNAASTWIGLPKWDLCKWDESDVLAA